MTHRAIIVDKPLPDARPEAIIARREDPEVSDGLLDLDVHFSSVNYKDAIALTGGSGILRSLPLVPGIDAVGAVRTAASGFASGQLVVVTGAGLGERIDGGLAERAAVPATAAVPVPPEMTPRQAAAIGTAGFTAALSVDALLARGVTAESGEILVTGAGGGVGSFAIALLAAAGLRPVACTGRADQLRDHLTELGAVRVVGREELGVDVGKPLQSARWAGGVDSVGGAPLVNLVAQTAYDGVVAACGIAAGTDLPGSMMPFILRGVSLVGINSVEAPPDRRAAAWKRLAALPLDVIDRIAPRTVPLDRATGVARELLAGRVAGRVVVDVRA